MARARRSRCWHGRAPIPPDDPARIGVCPIVVTAQMAAADQAWTDALRRHYYPPDRNRLPAHLTLFHHLPPSCLAELQGQLALLAREARPAARVDRLMSLGGGVALHVDSATLIAMRDGLAEHFRSVLTPQDRARPRLHVTVQNKVPAAVARATMAELEKGFQPRPLAITGLAAWEYRGGPWELVRDYGFRG